MPPIRVKICGLTRADELAACIDAGAAYIGFNFFQKSPRYVTPKAARDLALDVPPGVAKVALVVDAEDAVLDAILDATPIDILQFHGSESPEEVTRLRARYGLPVMKALGIASADDLPAIDAYAQVSDQLLIDAKPPKDAVLPGGNGIAFDWRLIASRRWACPWMLAGGLTPDNVAEAIALTGATQIDVSSGVESTPGRKDADLVRAFITAANR